MGNFICYNYIIIKREDDDNEEYDSISINDESMSEAYYALSTLILEINSFSIESLLEDENVNLDCFGVNIESMIEKFEGDSWHYVYNALLSNSIDRFEDIYPQLNHCNSVKLKKENFIELMKRWQQDVLVNKPEFVLLWQDQQYKVYLECFEDEDSVRKRVDEVKRVVGEEDIED